MLRCAPPWQHAPIGTPCLRGRAHNSQVALPTALTFGSLITRLPNGPTFPIDMDASISINVPLITYVRNPTVNGTVAPSEWRLGLGCTDWFERARWRALSKCDCCSCASGCTTLEHAPFHNSLHRRDGQTGPCWLLCILCRQHPTTRHQ